MALWALVSCNEDFLEKQPLDKLSQEAVFSSEPLMEQYVNALYQVISHPFTEGSLSACTDEAYFRFGGSSTNYIQRGEMNPDNVVLIQDGGPAHNTRNPHLNLWTRVWSYIRNMNFFLSRVDEAPIGDDVKKRLKGEVLFLRAWTYSNLLIRYGGVPIIDKVYNLGDEYIATRDNYDDCVSFVVTDIDEAIRLLSDKATVAGRACADAARALKARTYLYAASPLFNDPDDRTGSIFKGDYNRDKWKLAKDAAWEVIKRADEQGAYALGATYDDYWSNINSTEVIWAKFFDPTANAYAAQLYYSPGSDGFSGWYSCLPVENIVVDYEMAVTGLKPFEAGSGYDPANPWAGRDPRFYKSILHPEQEYRGKTIRICTPALGNTVITNNDLWYGAISGTGGTGYWLHKWLLDDVEISESLTGSLMYPWFRLAEFYLIYAEASLELNDDVVTCAEYINKIRDRADVMMPHVSSSLSVSEMRAKLVQERRIEFAFEDKRFFDLRRWKLASKYENIMLHGISGFRHDDNTITWAIAKQGVNGEPDFSDCRMDNKGENGGNGMFTVRNFYRKHYLQPIPRNEFTKAQGTIVQNPYYDTDPELK
jgi:hypothetical protein